MDHLLKNQNANKIPFGRKCDRDTANQIMKYHMTLVHWAKEYDAVFLPRVERIQFVPFKIIVTGTNMLYAEEGSLLLYFSVVPGDEFLHAMENIQNVMGMQTSSFFHITIAVSQDHPYIQRLKEVVDEQCVYPFELMVSGLDLYHIWTPTRMDKHISAP